MLETINDKLLNIMSEQLSGMLLKIESSASIKFLNNASSSELNKSYILVNILQLARNPTIPKAIV